MLSSLEPAFEKYNEEQCVTARLPGSSQQVIVSSRSSLGGGRYYDVESSSSFAFDHATQKASAVQSHVLDGPQTDLVYVSDAPCCPAKLTRRRRKSILKSLSPYVEEHFANASHGAYPVEDDSKVAIIIVANKYSPNNFWYASPTRGSPAAR